MAEVRKITLSESEIPEAWFSGSLRRHELTQAEVDAAVGQIDTPEIPA